MSADAIRDRLLAWGRELFDAPRKPFPFTNNAEADALLNDLDGYPHAFVLASVMDRQIKAEKAWLIPHRIRERRGTFEFDALRALSLDEVRKLMNDPTPLHRYTEEMSLNLYEAIQRIAGVYDGDASRIWSGTPTSAHVVYSFLQFRGVGPKIATMAANILARDFKVPLADYFCIDISADVHVRRVFGRLGLTEPDASVDELVYRARGLHPEFPGLLDMPTWEIGRRWCRPREPLCAECGMHAVCPSASA